MAGGASALTPDARASECQPAAADRIRLPAAAAFEEVGAPARAQLSWQHAYLPHAAGCCNFRELIGKTEMAQAVKMALNSVRYCLTSLKLMLQSCMCTSG